MSKQPRHQEIFSELKAEILAGTYDSAKRLPSEAQLVARFGVSRPTVARALQELKLSGMLERRAGSGTYLKKNAEQPARTKQIGLIVPGLGKIEIFDVICGELASLARVHDLGMHWGGSTHPRVDSSMSVAEAEGLCEYYIEKGVSGVFFAPFEHTTDNEAANRRIAERLSHGGRLVYLPSMIWQQAMVVSNWPFAATAAVSLLLSVLTVSAVIMAAGRVAEGRTHG